MIIVIQCKDKVGLVAEISKVLASFRLNIISMREFVDTVGYEFFARLEVTYYDDSKSLQKALNEVLPNNALVKVNPNPDKRVVVLVTKEHHCLSDILVRNHYQTLGAKVECVIGNHSNLKDLCDRFDVPFYHIDHQQKTKEHFEEEVIAIIKKHQFDYLILAKFMRILSPNFIDSFPNQIINIHHSFLPAFIGASPYKQAFERGVKLIGATSHFVTNHLDEGPIITQQTISVNHTFSATDMVKAGKEIESSVLSKAIQAVFEDRVFVFGNKTVVFD